MFCLNIEQCFKLEHFFKHTFVFLNLTYQKSLPDVLEAASPSVVNIWSIKKWKAWQEKSNLLGIKRYQQVIKTGFFPNGSGVVLNEDGKKLWSKNS